MQIPKRKRTPRTNPPPPRSAAATASPLSDLPEPLIHHITSFLPPQSASQLCLLSTQFLSAWNSTPHLSFEHSSYRDKKKTARFFNYIQSTISRRPIGVNLQKFRIQFKSCQKSEQHPCIDSAIDYAINSGVLALDLDLRNQFYPLPPRILSCSSLTTLYLSGFNLDPTGSLHGSLTISYPLLEDLKLSSSKGIHSLRIGSCPKLKSLEIGSCKRLESLDIDSQTSNIDSLRSLKLTGSPVTDEWLERHASVLGKLERLELNSCVGLQNVTISNHRLESLALIGCDKLEKVQLDTINLDEFHYGAGNAPKLPDFVLCSSSRLLARVSLPYQMLINPTSFELSRHNLKSLGHAKELHLRVSSVKSLTISKSFRELKIAPWYDLRTMGVEITGRVTSGEIVDLVDSLLWLAPHLNVVSLLMLGKRKTLKFKYEEEVKTIDTGCDRPIDIWCDQPMDRCCKPSWPINCWRHNLREVTMENLEDQEMTELQKFFMHTSRMYRDKPIICSGPEMMEC
ncbi:F-box/FBD/LRR-repeat protein At1g78750 [Linum grandiflorum]